MIYLFAADSDSNLQSMGHQIQMQKTLLEEFFRDVRQPLMTRFSGGALFDDICEWKVPAGEDHFRFDCDESGRLDCIYIADLFSAAVDLSHVPPTVTGLQIFGCDIDRPLQTRHLPRCAEIVDLSRDMLWGELNLTHLPSALNYFSVQSNSFSGSVTLQNIPPKLMLIDISMNNLRMKTLYYGQLPHSIEIYLKGNRIGKVMPIDASRFQVPEPKEKVFTGVPWGIIH